MQKHGNGRAFVEQEHLDGDISRESWGMSEPARFKGVISSCPLIRIFISKRLEKLRIPKITPDKASPGAHRLRRSQSHARSKANKARDRRGLPSFDWTSWFLSGEFCLQHFDPSGMLGQPNPSSRHASRSKAASATSKAYTVSNMLWLSLKSAGRNALSIGSSKSLVHL
jgi:hypothetical protein